MIVNPQLEKAFSGFGLKRNDELMREAEIMRKDMYAYAKGAWSIISGEQFIDSWHIGNLCYHAQALVEGQIRRLAVNMPYRVGKTMVFAKTLPTWAWAHNPSETIISASHSLQAASDSATDSRRIIQSDWYQKRFCFDWQMYDDQNEKLKYKNTKNGERQAVSVGSQGTTGKGGGIQIIDDPLDASNANSKLAKETMIEWYKGTFASRAQNLNLVRIVAVAQRLATDDFFGWAQEQGNWEFLIMPNRYEREYYLMTPLKKRNPSFAYEDPRTLEGELLFEPRMNEETTLFFEKQDRHAAAAQLQQRPTVRGGGAWQSAWCPSYCFLPQLKRRFIIVDTAAKDGQLNDYTCFTLYGQGLDDHLYVIDVLRTKCESIELLKLLKIFWNKNCWFEPTLGEVHVSGLYVEDKMSGIGLIQETKKTTALPVIPIKRKSVSKMQRFDDCSTYLEAGLVSLPEKAPWLEDIKFEIDSLTLDNRHKHDDFADTLSDAIWMLYIQPLMEPKGDLSRYRPNRLARFR